MKLKKYNCESGSLVTEFIAAPATWKKIRSYFRIRNRDGKIDIDTRKSIRAFLKSEKTDYHYHFIARKLKKNKLCLEVTFHQDSRKVNIKKLEGVYFITNLESFLAGFLPDNLKFEPLKLNWRLGFIFLRKEYTPIIDLPFKDQNLISDTQHLLSNISVSGLKLEFDGAPSGIVRIYFEAFPKFISLGTIMQSKAVLNDGLFENVVSSTYEIANLFLRKK